MQLTKVWGTLDEHKHFPYVDIYNEEEEAKAKIGTKHSDGFMIVGVLEGYCVVGEDGFCVADSADFYFTEDEAREDMERLQVLQLIGDSKLTVEETDTMLFDDGEKHLPFAVCTDDLVLKEFTTQQEAEEWVKKVTQSPRL